MRTASLLLMQITRQVYMHIYFRYCIYTLMYGVTQQLVSSHVQSRDDATILLAGTVQLGSQKLPRHGALHAARLPAIPRPYVAATTATTTQRDRRHSNGLATTPKPPPACAWRCSTSGRPPAVALPAAPAVRGRLGAVHLAGQHVHGGQTAVHRDALAGDVGGAAGAHQAGQGAGDLLGAREPAGSACAVGMYEYKLQ